MKLAILAGAIALIACSCAHAESPVPAPGHLITIDGIKCIGQLPDPKMWCSGYGYVVIGRDIPSPTYVVAGAQNNKR